jgi:hypothetical protein
MSRIEEQVMGKIRNRYDPHITQEWKDEICARIAERAAIGMQKNDGQTLERDDLSRLYWLIYTENKVLSAINSLEKLMDMSLTMGPEEQYFQNIQRGMIEHLFYLGQFIEQEQGLEIVGE